MVESAVEIHKKVRTSGRYSYDMSYNKSVPVSPPHIDCSSYVTWVVLNTGYKSDRFKEGMGQWTSYTFEDNPEGWQVIRNIQNAQAGDILAYSGHVEIYAGKMANGSYPKVYNMRRKCFNKCSGNKKFTRI